MNDEMSVEDLLGEGTDDVYVDDFTDVEEFSGFEPLSTGWHELEVIECEEAEGPKGDYLNLTLEAQDAEEGEGRRVWHILSFAPGAAGVRKGFLKATGLLEGDKFSWGPVGKRGDVLMGVRVMGNVRHEMYEGEPKAKIRSFKAVE